MGSLLLLVAFALSGGISALAFPPYDLPWVIWVAPVPALMAAVLAPPRVALLGGFFFGLAQGLLLLRWLFGIFGPYALSMQCLYAGFFALIFFLLRMAAWRKGPLVLLVLAPPLWVAVEFIRSEWFPVHFSWFALGYSQHHALGLLQAASIGGVTLLSLLIAAQNGALAWALLRPSLRRALVPLGVAALAGGTHLLGTALLRPAQGDIRVIGIEGEEEPLARYLELSESALQRAPDARLLIWPEYALDYRLAPGSPHLQRISALARQHGVPILLGATRESQGKRPNNFENTLFLVGADGQIAGTQVKSVPVPFFVDGQPARQRAPLPLPWGQVGAATCYDMDFPFVTEELVRKGAGVLVFPTMDAVHWGPIQHVQHASLAPFRAVEHRRWLVRVATSGISLVVDPYGRVTARTGIHEDRVLDARSGLWRETTVYTRFGYYLPHLCLIFTVLMLGGLVRRRR